MALSQIQCLDQYHVNLRTNESKPEFLYSEEQRLALERLLDDGPERFQDFIKTNRITPFLSDLELAHLSASVEPYCADAPDHSVGCDGDSKGTRLSLQYWPERSDDSVPQLELGWPQRASYRGVTRVTVHAQPPLHGETHIKEVVRRTIAQAQKVIAVVMDMFTDVDIFKDLLHASFKRNVAVYIILEVTGVPHFLKMCESAAMHTGHLKNLRVQSIRGSGFFTHSSKKVCGSQSQKFMFVDGDKAVSGSYSFTWTASRLDRSIITVLTGQAVDVFDQLFQDLYMMSNAVNLNKIHLEEEQKIEPISKTEPALQPSTTLAFKFINPKYTLVTGNSAANSNHVGSETCTAKGNNIKQMKEVPEGPHIHPGLLHLEKANMTDYLPVWPEPDPPSDVIGFINIRDCNKPLHAHLTRSELFEFSQAVRFKDPIHVSQESPAKQFGPRPSSTTDASANEGPPTRTEEHNQHCNASLQIPFSNCLEEQVVSLSPAPNPQPAHSSKKDESDSYMNHATEKRIDMLSKPREEMDAEDVIACSSAEPCIDSQISDNPQIHNITPVYCGCNTVPSHASVEQPEPISVKQSCENIAEPFVNKDIQDNQQNTQITKEPGTNETDHIDCPVFNESRTSSDTSSSFSSEEFFECYESMIVEAEVVAMVNKTPGVLRRLDESSTAMESLESLISGLRESASSNEAKKETVEFKLQAASSDICDGQDVNGVSTEKSCDLEFMSADGLNGVSESHWPADEVLHQVNTDAQVTPDEWTECLHECVLMNFAADHISCDNQPEERTAHTRATESQLLFNTKSLLDKVAASYMPVQKTAAAQCIVFSDTMNQVALLRSKPETCSGFNHTTDLESVFEVNVDTHSTLQSKPAGLQNTQNTESNLVCKTEDEDMDSSNSEPKESKKAQIVDKAQDLTLKTLTGLKVGQLCDDVHPLKKRTPLEHTRVPQLNKNKPEVKAKAERNVRKPHRVSPQPAPFPTLEVNLSSTKSSDTKLHSSNHLTTSPVCSLGVQNHPPARQSSQTRAANDLCATPAKLPRRHTVPIRSNRTQLRPSRTDLSAGHDCSSENQPQAQQDQIRVDQVHQSRVRQRSASATDDRSSVGGATFPKTLRTLKDRITGSPSLKSQKKTRSIKETDKK